MTVQEHYNGALNSFVFRGCIENRYHKVIENQEENTRVRVFSKEVLTEGNNSFKEIKFSSYEILIPKELLKSGFEKGNYKLVDKLEFNNFLNPYEEI
jgi:hypothetical protein